MYPAHDALSARIAEQAGAKAVTAGGFAASGVLLGQPDSSQLTATELAKFYEGICASVDIPVFVDADTGFGGVTNVIRTVKDFERAGVAGLFIEDQLFPKRCGHTAGKDVVSTEEMVPKLKAALDSRTDEDLVIMGRTDALGVLGIEDAIARANLYRQTGCDMVFVEAPETTLQMRRICKEVDGPKMANMVEQGDTPYLLEDELGEMGYKIARKHARRLRIIALVLGGAVPAVLAAFATQLPDLAGALVAAVAVISAGAGLLVERWLFFAEAVHTVSLYYGTDAA